MNTNIPFPAGRFVAIDVEYADNEQNICQFGLAVVRDRKIVDSRSWLIQPPGNHYEERCIRVHHITPADTEDAPTFPEVWPEIQPYLLEGQLWAHNAASAEIPVITKNLRQWGISADWLDINDSRELFQRPDCPANSGNGLEQCCMAMGVKCESHHDAEADALMCAGLLIRLQHGIRPEWGGVPKSSEEARKSQQEKRILRLGEFRAYYASGEAGDKDAFAEMASTCDGAVPQTVDVFDKGDRFHEAGEGSIDFSRIDTGEGNPIRGKRVVVTGMFRYPRKDVENAVDAMGAKRVPKPNKKTDAVILGTRNVGFTKLCAIEELQDGGHPMALIVGNDDLDALLYGDGHKFFNQ